MRKPEHFLPTGRKRDPRVNRRRFIRLSPLVWTAGVVCVAGCASDDANPNADATLTTSSASDTTLARPSAPQATQPGASMPAIPMTPGVPGATETPIPSAMPTETASAQPMGTGGALPVGTGGMTTTSGGAGAAGSAGSGVAGDDAAGGTGNSVGGAPGMGGAAPLGGAASVAGAANWNPESDDDGELPEIGPSFSDEGLDVRDVPHGTVYRMEMSSNDSQIYPGLNGPYTRPIDVYIPAQYVDGTAAPFIVVQDGPGYTNRMQRALDNLIAEGSVPALIAIMVQNGGGDSIGSERGLEYDTMSDVYVTFVDTELLPFVLANEEILDDYPNIALTDNPEGRAAMGCSSGAAAAFTMAWFGNDQYRRVLSYSGTFVDQQDPQVPTYSNGAWEYHEHLIAEETPNKPIRVYLEVGENDNGANQSEQGLHNWVLANQRMAEVLEAKGYVYQYQFAVGAGHCDGGAIGQTLYGALEWLWRGYPTE